MRTKESHDDILDISIFQADLVHEGSLAPTVHRHSLLEQFLYLHPLVWSDIHPYKLTRTLQTANGYRLLENRGMLMVVECAGAAGR